MIECGNDEVMVVKCELVSDLVILQPYGFIGFEIVLVESRNKPRRVK